MIRWTPEQIRGALGAIPKGALHNDPVEGVSIDTRQPMNDALFIAIRGENFDGHDFLGAAIDAGARVLVTHSAHHETPDLIARCKREGVVLLSAPSDRALQGLARAYRASLEMLKVVAITGSNGKTTTVRMVDAVLGAALRGRRSQKSFNNAIGVPLTILEADAGDDYLVSEVGMNSPGEIAPLARALRPDVVAITNIGHAHFEAFGTQEGIAREKAQLLTGLRQDGSAILNADTPALARALESDPRFQWFGRQPGRGVRVREVESSAEGVRFGLGDGSAWRAPLPGAHNALNATVAILVGRGFGIDDETIQRGLNATEPPPMRFEPVEAGGICFFNDAYNASPESVAAALETFAHVSEGAERRVVVLGDMLEMGDHTSPAHAEAIERARTLQPDLLLLYGGAFAAAADPDTTTFERVDERTLGEGAAMLRQGDAVLLKASRAIGLERMLDVVRSLQAGAP